MKTTFYVLSRNSEHGMEYLKKTGERVPDARLSLSVYKTEDMSKPVNPKTGKHPNIWYVVEETCGLSLSEGKTKKEAIGETLDRLDKYGVEFFQKSIDRANKTYGGPPDRRAVYL